MIVKINCVPEDLLQDVFVKVVKKHFFFRTKYKRRGENFSLGDANSVKSPLLIIQKGNSGPTLLMENGSNLVEFLFQICRGDGGG